MNLPRVFRSASRFQVVPKLAVPVGREAFALGDRPDEIGNVPGHDLGQSGLCLMIVNNGLEPVTVAEVGLNGRFGRPRIVMREPVVVDGKPWPRRLRAGESVVAYFAAELKKHHLLGQMRRAFAASGDGLTWEGHSPALVWFTGRARAPAPAARSIRRSART